MNYLFIENDFKLPHPMQVIFNALENKGIDKIEVLTRANNKLKELKELLPNVDVLMMQTTFLDGYQNRKVIDFLSSIKKPINVCIFSHNLEGHLLQVMEIEDFYNTKHHNIFSIEHYHGFDFNNSDCLIKLDFSEKVKEHEKVLKDKEDQLKRVSNNITDVKVKILINPNCGKEWGNLKPGDIVSVLNCEEIDPNPFRGIWVMGVTEPVKLINENNISEFEFVEGISLDLITNELLKTCKVEKPTEKDYRFIESVLNDKDYDNLSKAQIVLDEYGAQRRFNRSYFANLISKITNENN